MSASSSARPPATAAVSLPESARAELERRLTSGELELPLLPAAAFEVSRAAGQPDADPRQLAEIIKRDQALVTHVLRVVNSPLYAPRAPIVSLHQAAGRLGTSKIREVALLIAMRVGVFQARGFEADVERVFRHATAAGLMAQEIARATRRNVEDAFLAGLLHDVGRPVLLQAAADVLGAAVSEYADAMLAYVQREHARAGGLLARAWKLPTALASAIEQHHELEPRSDVLSVRVVQLADELAHGALDGDLDLETLSVHPACAALELYPHVLETILKQAPAARALAEAVS